MIPLRQKGQIPQQEINEQGRPHLPPHGVGAGAQKVSQLERLFDLLEEHFNLSATTI